MKLYQFIITIFLIALCSCAVPKKVTKSYDNKYVKSYGYEETQSGRYYYGGKYNGECGLDGLYYKDDQSFIFCSNGNNYVQPCAPGTRNSGYEQYTPGQYYAYSSFCDVNLVDYGYGANSHSYNYYGPKNVYDRDGYYNNDYKKSYGGSYYEEDKYDSHKPNYKPRSYDSDNKHEASYGYEKKHYGASETYGSEKSYSVPKFNNDQYKSEETYGRSYGYDSNDKYDYGKPYNGDKYAKHDKYDEPHGYESGIKYEESKGYERAHEYKEPNKYDSHKGYREDFENRSYGSKKVANTKTRGYKQEAAYEHKEDYQTRNTKVHKKVEY